MKKNIDGSKTAGQEIKEKQSQMDKAANLASEENNLTRQEDKRNRNRRDGSEKKSGSSDRS